jgi:hypothetical protein
MIKRVSSGEIYLKMTVFWYVVPCSLVEVYQHFRGACCLHNQGDVALMMEAASTPETSVNFYQTIWCNIPEDSHLHTHHHENLNLIEIYLSFFLHVPKMHYVCNLKVTFIIQE